jgi:hypothetical protein
MSIQRDEIHKQLEMVLLKEKKKRIIMFVKFAADAYPSNLGQGI